MTKLRPVTSREYKVMLRPGRFTGPERDLLAAADGLWRAFSRGVGAAAIRIDGALDEVTRRRLVMFLDTGKHDLGARGYILRRRRNVDDEEDELTLKFRHPDCHVSQDRDMRARDGHSKTKFEEDIKAPFTSLYSFSTTVKDVSLGVDRLGAVSNLFPDLAKRLKPLDGGLTVLPIRGFTARETVIGGGILQIGKTPVVDAECALIVWHDDSRPRARKPAVVEFSFRYGSDAGLYEGATARRAFEVFHLMQARLARWIDPNSRTKTAFVYG